MFWQSEWPRGGQGDWEGLSPCDWIYASEEAGHIFWDPGNNRHCTLGSHSSITQTLLSPIYRWGNWGPERLRDDSYASDWWGSHDLKPKMCVSKAVLVPIHLLSTYCVSGTILLCVCAQSLSPALWDPMECSPPGFSVHGSLQARMLGWVAILFSRGSSWLRNRTRVSYISKRILYHWATWKLYYCFRH